jgi:hypothetical protein
VGVADLNKHKQLLQSLGTGRLSYGDNDESIINISYRYFD